jgi:hypothetical protein
MNAVAASMESAARGIFSAASTAFSPRNFNETRGISYIRMGIESWRWLDALADMEAKFGRDLTKASDKFKIETIDQALEALFRAPKFAAVK